MITNQMDFQNLRYTSFTFKVAGSNVNNIVVASTGDPMTFTVTTITTASVTC